VSKRETIEAPATPIISESQSFVFAGRPEPGHCIELDGKKARAQSALEFILPAYQPGDRVFRAIVDEEIKTQP
jgi:hypothetical protein